jgi:multiple sugar transport system substrate-binding protein
MIKKSTLVIGSLLLAGSVLSACGSGGGAKEVSGVADDNSKHDPVTLTYGTFQGGYDEPTFNEFVKKPVEAKFPYITMEYSDTRKNDVLESAIAAGSAPDFINGGLRGLAGLKKLGLPENLDPYIKKYNLNPGNYNAAGVASIQDYSDKGQGLLALPYRINFYAMLYNKDIFDKFAVAYPHDNMSWDEVKKLAEKVTRQTDGIQYKGILPGNVTLMARGLSLSFIDPATNRAAINNDKWKNLFELALSMYKIPGNMPNNPNDLSNSSEFYKDKVLAMFPSYNSQITALAGNDNVGFNWDMTSYPSFESGKSAEVDTQILIVSAGGKHKDDAFKVIQFLTTSPEVQADLAKNALMPGLKLSNFEDLFGMNYPVLKQKNVKGVFKVEMRTPHPFNEYDDIVRSKVDSIFKNQYLTGKADTNTALRQIEEQANKAIIEANN